MCVCVYIHTSIQPQSCVSWTPVDCPLPRTCCIAAHAKDIDIAHCSSISMVVFLIVLILVFSFLIRCTIQLHLHAACSILYVFNVNEHRTCTSSTSLLLLLAFSNQLFCFFQKAKSSWIALSGWLSFAKGFILESLDHRANWNTFVWDILKREDIFA